MGRHYKEVKNGRGTNLTIDAGKYISVGYGGNDITVRGGGKVIAFDTWNDFINAIDFEKAVYHSCDYTGCEKIGECVVGKEGTILKLKRQYFGQGMIFKDYHAFFNEPNKPCYVPELSDTIYTRENFLTMSLGQEDIAEMIFRSVDWQHPETYLDEQFREGELDICKKCGRIFESYGAEKCPHCGAVYEREDD